MKNLLLVFISLSIFLFTSQAKAQIYANVDADSAQSLIQYHELDPNFIILDVRTQGEYDSKHIENGVNLNYYLATFDQILDTLIKDKVYLIHCASGGRSGNVFTSMQAKGFDEVYNLSGGLGAWESAGKPITTMINPILLSVSDTLVDFLSVQVGLDAGLDVTITNYANDTMDFLSITDLSGTAFSTNFNIDARLTGLMDYTFQIFYAPDAIQVDSLVLQIESENGIVELVLKGVGEPLAVEEEPRIASYSVYPNPSRGQVTVENEHNFSVELIDINGQTVFVGQSEAAKQRFDFSDKKAGVYFLKVISQGEAMVRKLVLL